MARVGTVAGSIVVAVLVATAAAVGLREIDRRQGPPIVIEDPLADATIVVSVAGAVASPGAYDLAPGARLGDALAAAGGPAADAELARVNPAARVADGEQVVVPARAPIAAGQAGGADRAAPTDSVPTQLAPTQDPEHSGDEPGLAEPSAPVGPPSGDGAPLDLNTASVEDLEVLPGIGPAIAARIVTRRDEMGPYASVDELVEIPGISARMVDDLRPLLVVGAPG
ncbi:MAG: hypothetical protein AVDCRST_MAG49-1152 [uncultured Thermomicrobiales bacterium]|uniref:Soluble ligand binding domain-containing protein n=1 Tax=uncultured Thermomicrobiales bacterium TaxID=1645740 RepID=A0A6J4UDY5_9BACT|nr:MAG: hypothetical protein AVDCRST_MAG49-1152 [uncultured Thermomicrobiales bacterium]